MTAWSGSTAPSSPYRHRSPRRWSTPSTARVGSTTSPTFPTCASTPPAPAGAPTAAASTSSPTTSSPPSSSAVAPSGRGDRCPTTGSGRSSVRRPRRADRCSTRRPTRSRNGCGRRRRRSIGACSASTTPTIVQLIRWRHAVPAVHPGYFGRMRSFAQRPPLVFAGDWLVQPCVEGAVRSGNIAAACFTGSRQPEGKAAAMIDIGPDEIERYRSEGYLRARQRARRGRAQRAAGRRAALPGRQPVRHVRRARRHRAARAHVVGGAPVLLRGAPPRCGRDPPRTRLRPHPQPVHRQAAGDVERDQRHPAAPGQRLRAPRTAGRHHRLGRPHRHHHRERLPRRRPAVAPRRPRRAQGGGDEPGAAPGGERSTPCRSSSPPARPSPSAG